jgi:hypothetical protein
MRRTPWTGAACAAAALRLSAGGSSGGDGQGKPFDDDGDARTYLLPAPPEGEEAPEGLDEVLPTIPKPEDGWLSAPWTLAGEVGPDSTEVRIVYVAGDTKCYGHAGFTLDESGSNATLGSYVFKVPDATDCPDNPAAALKWGTVNLAEPLGTRQLRHAGLAEAYAAYTWEERPAEESAPPAASEEPEEPEEATE